MDHALQVMLTILALGGALIFFFYAFSGVPERNSRLGVKPFTPDNHPRCPHCHNELQQVIIQEIKDTLWLSMSCPSCRTLLNIMK